MDRSQYAAIIEKRLREELERMRDEFREHTVQSCVIDHLLPEEEVVTIFKAFPDKDTMMLKKSLRENKYVAAQMNKYSSLLEEIVFAFQDPRVLKVIEEITGIHDMIPDEHLYAGGISLMAKDNFLNPHLDNSHDKNRQMYRVLNLLYYVTPDWREEFGGNLELWDNGPKESQRVITAKFNRLALMATHEKSWHSVSQVVVDRSRCCVSNYYFSAKPLEDHDYFHVTSFRGRPEQPVRDLVLQGDIALRQAVRTVFKKGIVENKHVYKKD
ncbi:2OG-Fe(II) oxygenase [Tunturiibacter psychrotolerans]|jgi:Rps23 Pro-64 3,4-dihydroxylase Tpa1-like proline 4-hydroxylase|uniref:2OG-Fe(II) oxygenase n=1 Tax=Tunturiibacter psychrotolerans TaxID=3069686 RepID=UPI003D1DF6DA